MKGNVKGNVKGNEDVGTSSYGLTWNLDHVLHLSTSGGHTAVVMNNGTSHRSTNPRNKKRPTYQNKIGQTTCKDCIEGRYQLEVAESYCLP